MTFRAHACPLQRVLLAISACMVLTAFHPVPAPAAEAGIIDCHVHLWTLARPDGVDWIKKDDPVLYRDYLPADFEAEAKANGVEGVVLVQAGQSLPDNQWNLDVTAHNRKSPRNHCASWPTKDGSHCGTGNTSRRI